MRKFLLLTDCLPSPELTAGIMVAHLCRRFPQNSLCCYGVTTDSAEVAEDLRWLPVEWECGPRQFMPTSGPQLVRRAYSLAHHQLLAPRRLAKIVSRIVRFAEAQQVEAIWCQLQGLNLIRLARPVTERLGVPLFTQVLDPPTFMLRLAHADDRSSGKILREFGRAIEISQRTATISQNMASDLHAAYGTETVVVMPGFHADLAHDVSTEPTSSDTFSIAIAGQVYAAAEFRALLAALHSVKWKLAGKQIVLRCLGRRFEFQSMLPARIEYLGFHTQASSLEVLANSDLLYSAYWLSPNFAIEARQAFPSKLSTYLASGRPVLFHGPQGCSPDSFLAEHHAAFRCHSNETSEILAVLESAIRNREEYAKVACGGRVAFERHLTLDRQRILFAKFLGVDLDELTDVHPYRVRSTAA